jgi:hypothetical protein
MRAASSLRFRDFSFDSGILHAFKGVMNFFSSQLGNFHWGLTTACFSPALLLDLSQTDTGDKTRRRMEFPSWSWVSWRRADPATFASGIISPGNAATLGRTARAFYKQHALCGLDHNTADKTISARTTPRGTSSVCIQRN